MQSVVQPRSDVASQLELLRPELRAWLIGQVGHATRRYFSADDLINDVMLEASRRLNALPTSRPRLWLWLRRSARNRLTDRLRYLRRDKRNVDLRAALSGSALLALCQGIPGDDRSPSSENATREAVLALREALSKIKPEYCQAITLHHLYGQAIATVAEKMGKSPRAVQGLIDRGLLKVRRNLGKSERFFRGRRRDG